jgi:hypothetical protein
MSPPEPSSGGPGQAQVTLELRGARMLVTAPQVDGLGYAVPGDVRLVDAPPGSGSTDSRLYPRLESSLPKGGRSADASADCLIEFIDLHYLSEEQFRARVLSFARRWGLLGICKHGEPAGHARGSCWSLGLAGEDGNLDYMWEPLEAWRRYSRQLDGMLRVAARLRVGEAGLPKDWEAIAAAEPSPLPGRKAHSGRKAHWTPRASAGDIGSERQMFGVALVRWLQFGNVVSDAIWRPDEPTPTIRLSHKSLAGVLAVQLAAAVQSQEGVYTCAECGRPFTLPPGARRRARTLDAYCSRTTCGRKAVVRNSQRRRYHDQPRRYNMKEADQRG